ncbi:MAG: T9SS type A sorting domain-containing protein, partial [Chlorobi bacterium]|nr:T9SS type A sorting domain-containing protein [Chlorobiota bacterium]
EFEHGRAHVAIYNFAEKPTVAVDLSGVLNSGDSLIVYDAENIVGATPVIKTVYNGGTVDFPMTTNTLAPHPPYKFPTSHTPIDFGVFLVITRTLNIPDFYYKWKSPEIGYIDPMVDVDECNRIASLGGVVYYSTPGTKVGISVMDSMFTNTLITQTDIADEDGWNIDSIDVTSLYYGKMYLLTADGENRDTMEFTHVPPSVSLNGAYMEKEFFNHLSYNMSSNAQDTIHITVINPDKDTVYQYNQIAIRSRTPYTNGFCMDLSDQQDYSSNYTITLENGYNSDYFVYPFSSLSEVKITRRRPNPTTGVFTLAYVAPDAGSAKIEVKDGSGSTVFSTTQIARKGSNLLNIDLSSEPDGEYYPYVILNSVTVHDTIVKSSTGVSPHLKDDNATVTANGTTLIDVFANDEAGILTEYLILTDVRGGTAVENNAGQVYFESDGSPTASFWYTSKLDSEDKEPTNSAFVSITVTGAPDYVDIKSCEPDPFVDTTVVKYYSSAQQEVKLQTKNPNGEIVFVKTIEASEGDNEEPVVLTGKDNGEYKIYLYAGESSDSCVVTKQDVADSLKIVSYSPVQTFDTVTVVLYSPQTRDVNVRVVNSSGTELKSYNISVVKGDNDVIIDLTGLSEGNYLLEFKDGDTEESCTVTKRRPLEILSYAPDTTYDIVTVRFYAPEDENITVTAFNSSGNQILSKGITAKEGENNSVDVDFTGNVAGDYTIKLTDLNITVSCVVTKTDRPRPLEIISYSPNPTYDMVNVVYYSPVEESISVLVKNSSGAEVYSGAHSATEGENNNIPIDLTTNPVGIYTIILSNATQTDSCKVTKEDESSPPQPLSILSYPESTYDIAVIEFYIPEDNGVSVVVLNSSSEKVIEFNYLATKGNNTINVDLSDQVPGDYRITINDGETTDSCTVKKYVKEEPVNYELISASPDPAVDLFSITFINPEDGSVVVKVYDDAGRVILRDGFKVVKGNNKIVLDLFRLPSGRYIVKIDNGYGIIETSVTKQAVL